MLALRSSATQPLSVKKVKKFYFTHLPTLDLEQQVFFAWMLFIWNGDSEAFDHLQRLKPQLTEKTWLNLFKRLEAQSASGSYGKGKSVAIQSKYLARHPGLLAKSWQLIYILRLQSIFKIDGCDELMRYHSRAAFAYTYERLLQDPEAIAMLPGAALGYLYLTERFIFKTPVSIIDITELLHKCLPFYDLKNDMHLKLLSYLQTHFIIDESLFFTRALPASKQKAYESLIEEAEALLAKHYFAFGLDNKYEFLACSQFVGHSSLLKPIINSEAARSVVHGAGYTADTLNCNPNKHLANANNMAHSMAFYVLYKSKRLPQRKPFA